MKTLLIFLQLFFITIIAWSQPDTASNSFEQTYKRSNQSINYNYENEKQIHNYSNNWDLDNDGKPDQVYFIGTGGAHLYFFLRVVLSTDNRTRDFSFIQSDFPVLPSDKELQKASFNPKINSTQFAVFGNSNKSIFVKLDDQSFFSNKKMLNKKGIKTPYIMLSFKNGKSVCKDFVDKSN
jgi:hypothetical protein